ncbi:site-specific integrase [Olleya sp. AS48]|uniref:site-specific integrase n=1 Tax=Olleya sp. AS48 TaxID=3135774 RepID=UPI0031746887
MNNNRLLILFLLQKVRQNKKGECPIRCRITYAKKRKEFSTGFFVNPKMWYSKMQKTQPSNKENDFINTQLGLIKQNINQAFLFLQVNNITFDVEDILFQYKGENIKSQKTLLEVFDIHNAKMKKLIGLEYTQSTMNKFNEAKSHIQNFIRSKYNRSDVALESLTIKFIDDFDFYLKSEKEHKQITINKSIQRVRKIIKLAIAEEYLLKDPFLLYKPKRYERKVVYLDTKELARLEEYNIAQTRLKQVRDMFVFCCYTGLAYAEMSVLSREHIIKGFDGNEWIHMYRKKTNSKVSVPLLPTAKIIIARYQDMTDDKLLPVISNQKFNSYLKEIAEIVCINKRLTHHIARKTFATTVLLYNDVPMEIVSELLGHSKVDITQRHYAKVVQKKVSEHIMNLKSKLKDRK